MSRLDRHDIDSLFSKGGLTIRPEFNSDEDLKRMGELLIEKGEELLEEYESVTGDGGD